MSPQLSDFRYSRENTASQYCFGYVLSPEPDELAAPVSLASGKGIFVSPDSPMLKTIDIEVSPLCPPEVEDYRYETQDAEPNFTFELHTVRVGDCAISTNPFELYLHYGQIIKARSHAFQTFLVQLCPGGGGYLPSPEAERLGGYGGMIVNGNCGSDGGYKLADTAVGKINGLFD